MPRDSKERADCQGRDSKKRQAEIHLKRERRKPSQLEIQTNPKGTKKPMGPIKKFSSACYFENQTHRQHENAVQKIALFARIHQLFAYCCALLPLSCDRMCICVLELTSEPFKVVGRMLNLPLNEYFDVYLLKRETFSCSNIIYGILNINTLLNISPYSDFSYRPNTVFYTSFVFKILKDHRLHHNCHYFVSV